jgi:hypothetical protein
MRSKIFESETELGQNFFVRNALATVEEGAGSVDLVTCRTVFPLRCQPISRPLCRIPFLSNQG